MPSGSTTERQSYNASDLLFYSHHDSGNDTDETETLASDTESSFGGSIAPTNSIQADTEFDLEQYADDSEIGDASDTHDDRISCS